jgi:acyl-CoA reductase-like NAD-dependent aldehyde dehydrogenase
MTVESAIAAAQQWNPPPLATRLQGLRRFAALLTHRSEDMASLITRATAKPITLSRAEVMRALSTLQGTIATAAAMSPRHLQVGKLHGWAQVHRLPLGVVLAVTPFNFPLNLALHKLAPAHAAGCPVLWKPSPQAPGVAESVRSLMTEAGIDAGAVVVCPWSNEEVEAACADHRLAVMTFTGSVAVGRHLQGLTRRARSLLELGGNAAVILDQVRDPAPVAAKVAAAACAHAGQVCISVQRIFHPVGSPEWPGLLQEAFRALPQGDPWREETVCGPVISVAAKERISQVLSGYRDAGGTVLCGGTWDGLVLAPTLIAGVAPSHPLVRDTEIFAPIATLHPYHDLDQAVDLVNDTPFGLQAALYNNDEKATQRAFERLQVGTLVLNEVPSQRDDRLPYGGMKDSGVGREGTFESVFDYCQFHVLYHPGSG